MKRLILWLIGLYQRWISPLLPPACRFVPTCSRYTAEAVQTHGALRGLALGAWRICRCHPFSKGGHDPVPPPKPRREDFSCGSPVEPGQAIMPPLAPDQGGKKEDSCFQP